MKKRAIEIGAATVERTTRGRYEWRDAELGKRTWGGDSYVTDDGDDSAENGVLAGGGDCRVIDKWGTLGQGCHSAPFSNAIILSKWSFS